VIVVVAGVVAPSGAIKGWTDLIRVLLSRAQISENSAMEFAGRFVDDRLSLRDIGAAVNDTQNLSMEIAHN
jgi:hypothetical protein